MSDLEAPWDDPASDPLADMAAWATEARERFTYSKFVMPPGVSRALDERLGRDWRGQIDRDMWVITDEQEEQ